MSESEHKPIIETMINTCALALTATGTNMCIQEKMFGFILILFGAGLEFIKYAGRKKKMW